MAFASALNTPKGLHCLTLPSSRNERPPTNLILPRQFPARFSSTLALARRRNQRTEVASSKPKIKKEDLKNDDASLDDEDLTEEELAKLEQEIKILAAELCLDRPVVLELLRNPPPSLLMMCAALPDEPAPTISASQTMPVETVVESTVETVVETTTESSEVEPTVKVPIHVMQQKFSAQKRLKKAHVETLESVYRKSKRPTNAMISSIVHVTNLPRKRVVKWFEDKRSEDGVTESRLPYRRPTPNTA
ncbi:protein OVEREXPRESSOR OF CATIONIC PEROXIDASE 3 [Prunus yedoensis var. nudiflora]|uniref:Protein OVEREXPRESSOR OF CATIONIC PEROXIDASE 3 n=1 Tax=Prunus yedoensis var. nudiflora TaxID=2094558 RepID=A0A314U752_PRUYE|nr:protein OVEREXPRESSOR OF CATIONIC PEROXIDASE 3 [Prunus yedoensis var. nudiflora]